MLISKNFLTREASYKPSYFTSWSQSGPAGTVVDLVGRQKSKALNMRGKIGIAGAICESQRLTASKNSRTEADTSPNST